MNMKQRIIHNDDFGRIRYKIDTFRSSPRTPTYSQVLLSFNYCLLKSFTKFCFARNFFPAFRFDINKRLESIVTTVHTP